MNSPALLRSVALLLVLSFIPAWAGEPKSATPGGHIWDHAAVARCSSMCQREVITDPQAKDGRAARLSGEANFVSLHDEIPTAPGAGFTHYHITTRDKEDADTCGSPLRR